MVKDFKIYNKNIQVYYNNIELEKLPVVILNTFGNGGKEVYNKCLEIKCKDFILISI